MASLEAEPKHRVSDKGRLFAGWRLAVAACLVASVGIGLQLLMWSGRSLEERLRAIDAAYAIPEEENAAKAYTELTWGYSGPSLEPWLLPKSVQTATVTQPWRSADYPQVAKWLEDRRSVVDSLMDISRKPDCRFSIVDAFREAPMRAGAARQMFPLLLQAANNDLGEGRTEAGLEKLLGALRVARHFRTQISPSDNDVGRTILRRSLQLGRCRTARILLALRCYKNEAGTWPTSLREIESKVPPGALIDPVSGEPFAYRLMDDGVFVYSVGLNRVDENGIGGDDFVLWPN